MCLEIEPGDGSSVPTSLQKGNLERGVRIVATAQRFFELNPRTAQSRLLVERMLAVAGSQIDQQTFQQLWQEGEAMALTDAIAYALGSTAHPLDNTLFPASSTNIS
jgi:hypothetical protein